MWPFKKEKSLATIITERLEIFTEHCAICSKDIQCFYSRGMKALGPYCSYRFGEYKPATIWYCRSHSNKEIEEKIKELDV